MNIASKKTLIVLIIVLVLITIYYPSISRKKSSEYDEAKLKISEFIKLHYSDVLILDDVSYNSKQSSYIGRVSEVNDRTNKSFVEYFPYSGYIYNDYHYRTITKIEDKLRIVLETLITTSSHISEDILQIDPIIEVPLFKYTMADEFDPDIPIQLRLRIKSEYADIDKFSRDTYKILNSLYSSSLKFKTIEIYSLIPNDGNKSYYFIAEDNEKDYSLESVEELAFIRFGEK